MYPRALLHIFAETTVFLFYPIPTPFKMTEGPSDLKSGFIFLVTPDLTEVNP